jgi:hypothetical protein
MPPAAPPGRRWPLSVILLVAANAVPLVGVLGHRWTVLSVLLLYWCENVTIGAFNVLRIVCARPGDTGDWADKVFWIPFFIVHYGIFTWVHGVLILTIFGGGPPVHDGAGLSPLDLAGAVRRAGLGVAVLALALSHGFSFVRNYLMGGEYRRIGPRELMALPYGRVVLLHVTIIGGAFLVTALGSPLPALVLMIALKTVIDVLAHLAERRKLGEHSGAATATAQVG